MKDLEQIGAEIRSIAKDLFEPDHIESFVLTFQNLLDETDGNLVDYILQVSTDEGNELEIGFFTDTRIADVTLSRGKVYSYVYPSSTIQGIVLSDNDSKWTLVISGEKKFDYNVVKPSSLLTLQKFEKSLNEHRSRLDQKEISIQRPSSHFDQDLRDVPDNRKEWESFVDELKNKLKTETHAEKRLQLLEHIGMAARTLMKLDEAESYLMKALSHSYSCPSHSRLVQNLIRLGHAYQWKKDFEKSQLLFDQAKSLINEKPVSEGLTAAYHQHLGKLYFDQKYYGKAQAEFSTALSIRERISAPEDQMESSKESLKEALKRWGRNFSGIYIRRAIPKDAEAIHRAHMKSIQEICSKDHSPQEIQAWGHRPYREDQRVGSIKNDIVWVVEDGGSIEGYGHLRVFEKDGLKRGHIFGLYLTPMVVGKSLGKAIVDLMMEEIKTAKGLI
jgi:tetratricopeptide (TPR) repeat protein